MAGSNPFDGNIASSALPTGAATESKQDSILAELQNNKTHDDGNSTSTPLTGGATFTGNWVDTNGYIQAIVTIITDQNAATDGLRLEVSNDGINVLHPHIFSPLANSPDGHHYPTTLEGKYFRVKYTNGAVAQSTFVISTELFKTASEEGHVHPINYAFDDDHPAPVVRSILTGKNPSGNYVNVQTTTAGNTKVSLEELESGISVNSNSQLKTTLYKSDGTELLINGGGEVVTLGHTQHSIHDGDHYIIADIDTDVDIATPKYWHIKAPDTAVRIHLLYDYHCTKNAQFELFRDPTTSANGTALTPYNSDQNSSNTSTLLAYYDPTVIVDGTRIDVEAIGDDNANPTGTAGEHKREDDEIILKQNTSYLFKFTALTDNMRTSIKFKYIET